MTMTKAKRPALAPQQERGEIEANPIVLPARAVQAIAGRLDELVSSLFVQFHQYQKHHWVVQGPQFRDLHLYLESAYNEVHRDLDAVAERMTVLGAVPTGAPDNLSERAFVRHEAEGVFGVREMLERDLASEKVLISEMRSIIPIATDETDFGTETLLKAVLLRAEERAHHLDHYLASDSLEAKA